MSYVAAIGTGLAPGEEILFTTAFSPARRVIVEPEATSRPPGTIIAYADVLVAGAKAPSGAVFGRIRSIPINRIGIFINGVPESSSFGGWFLRLYAVNRSNLGTIGYTVYVDNTQTP